MSRAVTTRRTCSIVCMVPDAGSSGFHDAIQVWNAYVDAAAPDSLHFTTTLQLDVAVARCGLLYPDALPSPEFDAYVNRVKTALSLWR